MEQHQRRYQNTDRGGRPDRQERDSESRWSSDSGRTRPQYEPREDERYDGGQGRFEPHRVSDDDRSTQGDSRFRSLQQGHAQYEGHYGGGQPVGAGSSASWQSSREGSGGQAGSDWAQRSSQQQGWPGGGSQDQQPRRSGGFAGRGPKDYQRSDERIREQISDRMSDDDDLDASDISVQVQKGEVTLTGTVQSRDQKRRAEDLAEQCGGVSDVVNNIRVSREQSGSTSSGQPSSPSGSSQSATQAGQKATGKSGGAGANT